MRFKMKEEANLFDEEDLDQQIDEIIDDGLDE
jgi:hypothetical protein